MGANFLSHVTGIRMGGLVWFPVCSLLVKLVLDLFGRGQNQCGLTVWSQHLAGGVDTNLEKVSVPSVTSQGLVYRSVF